MTDEQGNEGQGDGGDAVSRFVVSSERYLQWVNSKALEPQEELRIANLLLLEVNYQLLLLPEVGPGKNVQGVRPEASYQAYFEYRFQDFPARYYAFTANPFANPPEAPLIGDVGEDLTIIYLDLYEGLSIYHAKHHQEAVWFWRESFARTWGRNLLGALSAIYHVAVAPAG